MSDERFNYGPIQRHEALAPLSRDHYTGLVRARRLIRSSEGDDGAPRRQAVSDFVDAWDEEIAEHFADEERLLLDHLNETDRQRLLAEHAQLSMCADEARAARNHDDPGADLTRRIGEMLEAHIRWEERELFNRVQAELSDEALESIRRRTEAIEASRPRNHCKTTGKPNNAQEGES